jgi:hypothetical protein
MRWTGYLAQREGEETGIGYPLEIERDKDH